MYRMFTDLIGLLLICGGSVCGIAFGSILLGRPGSFMGLIAGALWGYQMSEDIALLVKTQQGCSTATIEENQPTFFSQPCETSGCTTKRTWLSRIFGGRVKESTHLDTVEALSLEEIHQRLREINSEIWRQLRIGVLSSCHVGLYSVTVEDAGESLDWREVNRRTVSCLHRFETATSDEERSLSLKEALGRIGQKLLLVQKSALRKADRLYPEEEQVIQKNEAELWRLSRMLP